MAAEVLCTQEGHLGLITLNRPEALNALTLNMILVIQKQLVLWKEDTSIHAVVVRAAPSKAFCAGGDVRWLYQFGQGIHPDQLQFFRHEYQLNHIIQQLGKPYIALMDGMTMGGGVGISLHGSHPVASERFVFAMPETSIGFFPDIGASYLLNRCPGALGTYLGLTGNRLNAVESLQAGLVRYLIPSEQLSEIVDGLQDMDLRIDAETRVHRYLQSYARSAEPIAAHPLMDNCFSKSTVEAILACLKASESVWAQEAVASLEQKAPLSLKITLAQLQKAQGLSLADCLKMDYTLVQHFMQEGDFYEGVRALLIDKDKNPHWSPARLELVSEQMVECYFESSLLELLNH